MSTGSVFIYAHLDEGARHLVRGALPEARLVFAEGGKSPDFREANQVRFQSCEVCFGNVPAEWLHSAPRLRWLQLESVGFEYYQGVPALPKSPVFTNLRGLFSRPAAETMLGGLLAYYRGLSQLALAQVKRRWVCLEVRPQTQQLHGRRVIVLGHGSIGRRVRILLSAFECHVQSFARTSADAELRTLDDLDRALPEADVVVSCLPQTPDTRGLFGRHRLALLSVTAIFANIGRGSVVDETALIDALQQGRLGGAVLDVTLEEPLPATHPLWSCPRTILLQHTGGGYRDELLDKARAFLANLARFDRGEPLENIVTLGHGY